MSEGLKCMDELPEGWEVKRLAYLGEFRKGRGIARDNITPEGVPAILYGDIYTQYDVKTDRLVKYTTPEVAAGAEPIQYGDLLLTGSGETKEDIGRCVVYLGKEQAYAGGDVIIFRQNQVDSLFLSYALNSSPSVAQKTQMGKGEIIVHIYSSDLRNLVVALPPLTTQRVIADYLDAETQRIDELIAAKRSMLALLEKKRAALVSQAVTKGLDHKAKMKHSGLEWLQEIPEHWGVERGKNIFRVRDVRSETGEEELMSVSHITGTTRRADKTVYMFKSLDNVGYKLCMKGDLVVNTLWAWAGAMGVSPQDGLVSPDYHVYQPTGLLLPEFVEVLCRSKPFVAEVQSLSTGVWTSRMRIYPETFLDIQFPVPPKDEQLAIIKRIASERERVRELIDATKESNTLLEKRRSALITAAVTGQVGVPELVKA